MSTIDDTLISSLSETVTPLPEAGDLTPADLPDDLRSRLHDAAVIGLGEASHGTREFFEQRFRLIRLLVEEFGVRAVSIEVRFDPFCQVDDLVTDGEGDIRTLLSEIDVFRPLKTETRVALFEWLQSYNADRPPEDRVHVYGFDMTYIRRVAAEIESHLDRVGTDVDSSLREDFGVMRAGWESEEERQAMLERTRQALSTLQPMVDANEAAWVEATSRRAYDDVQHRLHLMEAQIEAHQRDHEGQMALRDETMARNVEWIHDRSTGPVVLLGANGHLNRGRHVLKEWDVDVPSMGNWLAEAYGDAYCSIGLGLGSGAVAALDGTIDERVEYPIPEPPSGSIPDAFRQVDTSLFYVSVEGLHDDPMIREWLQTQPKRHQIWGGHPDGDDPVRYLASDLTEFDGFLFVRETSRTVPLNQEKDAEARTE
jgi:erythromycin esterase